MPRVECRMPNGCYKWYMQNGTCKMEHAKCRMPNGQCLELLNLPLMVNQHAPIHCHEPSFMKEKVD